MSRTTLNQLLAHHFRCAELPATFDLLGKRSDTAGYFRFGPDAVCYGRPCVSSPAREVNGMLVDLSTEVKMRNATCLLPFDPVEIIDNLRWERYAPGYPARNWAKSAYYLLRPFLPFALRNQLKQFVSSGWEQKRFPHWPVDQTVDHLFHECLRLAMKASATDALPFIWFWPNGYSGCVVMTHDVEAIAGLNFCPALMNLNDSYGIKSSFQFIPEGRYQVPDDLLDEIRVRGFEINVHDWNHDGHLFADLREFRKRALRINRVATTWGAEGFRSGALYRNPDWYEAFDLAYDMSVPNVGHLDPQVGGCCTVMPYFIGNMLELPLTMVQDYMLFHLLNNYSIDLWKQQLATILEGHGLASFIVHPDYIIESRARTTYTQLLDHLSQTAAEQNAWMALPGEVNRWWRNRSQMRLVRNGAGWQIEGPGNEQARIAFATLDGGHLSVRCEEQPFAAVS